MSINPTSERWPAAVSGYRDVNGLDMYYEIHGRGRPLVLLHGAMGTIESCFEKLLPGLAATRTVVAVELQGHGRTVDIDRPLSYQQMADDTVALVRALDIEVADFVGYSMGGAVALQIAMRHPAVVRRLVDAGGSWYHSLGLYSEVIEAFESGPPDLSGSVWHQAYVRVARDPGAWPTLVAKVNELDRQFRGWTDDEVRAVRTPTMLIIGDADIVRPEHTVAMFRLLGGGVVGDLIDAPPSQLAILPGTSHVGLLERVEWLQSMIISFLDDPNTSGRQQGADSPWGPPAGRRR
jgi:pimeloyl-ACP methyl ester carboxylesterase